MYICNALFHHGHSSFNLSILEYIDITNLSKDKAKKLILSREQHFLDSLEPKFNIQKIVGNSLEQKRSEKTKALISAIKSGIFRSEETKAKISEALKGKNHPLFVKLFQLNLKQK
jgi:group I intron endonuclease